MDIGSIGNANLLTEASASSGTLDKQAFLELLVTQLQHQDPLSPVSNEDFVAQLAQFSSVEQLENINASTETGLLLQQSMGNTMATNLIGQDVLLDGSYLELAGGQSRAISFELDSEARVTLEIRDGSGALVRTLVAEGEDGALLAPGSHQLDWDGLDESGASLADGSYQLSLSATDAAGVQSSLSPRQLGLVEGVRFSGGQAYLLVDGVEYSLADVLEIRTPQTS